MAILVQNQEPRQQVSSRWGGVILEYILITAFTLATGAAALAYITNLIKEKLSRLEESLDEPAESELGDFLGGS